MISFTNIFAFLFLFVTFESILVFTSIADLPTVFWWAINFLILLIAFVIKPKYYSSSFDDTPLLFIKLLLIWNFISVFRGFFVAENYWEWKNLIQTMYIMLIPFFTFLFINPEFVKKLISTWFKYMPYLVLVFIPFLTMSDFVARYLTPFMLLLLLFPLLSYRWKLVSLLVVFLILTTGLDARSMVIKFSMATFLGLLYYFKVVFWDKSIKIIHLALLSLPIVLLYLGTTNSFNVFNIKKYAGNNIVKSQEYSKDDLTADTRTFIYVETIESALKNDYLLEGRTPARGYDSEWFGGYNKWVLKTGKMERFASEVSILNIFTWNGLIGVVLYFLVFFYSSYLAIYKSSNYFIKVIGLFVAFRWSYAFVEDFTNFDIQYIFLWIFIAMCLSSGFRKMSDQEFKLWAKDLLNKSQLFRLGK
jgi:hypothetical protein